MKAPEAVTEGNQRLWVPLHVTTVITVILDKRVVFQENALVCVGEHKSTAPNPRLFDSFSHTVRASLGSSKTAPEAAARLHLLPVASGGSLYEGPSECGLRSV